MGMATALERDGTRSARDANPWAEVALSLGALAVFAAALLPASLLALRAAARRAREDGTLGQY